MMMMMTLRPNRKTQHLNYPHSDINSVQIFGESTQKFFILISYSGGEVLDIEVTLRNCGTARIKIKSLSKNTNLV